MKSSAGYYCLTLAIASLLICKPVNGQPPLISYQTILSGLSSPVDVVNAGDGSNRLFIVQQGGRILVWNGTVTKELINLGAGGENIISTGGERGLLSMAFHPLYDGSSNRYFFVYYTDINGDLALRRYQTSIADADVADVSSRQLLLTIPHPGQSNHNGGKLNFGTDGNLYFATGDGGGGGDVPNNAQNHALLLGKMIRIRVDNFDDAPFYTVPSDNPYLADASFDPKIFALGFRNPFRWSFDRLNGNMWIGDVGQSSREEINFRTPQAAAAGSNYGWRCYEGNQPFNTSGCAAISSYVFPVFDYANPGSAAVTGGFVYRGAEYPGFRGYYIATDFFSGNVFLVWPNGSGGWNNSTQPSVQSSISGFGEAEDGTLYAASLGGTLFKVVASGGTVLPVVLTSFGAHPFNGGNEIRWTTEAEKGTAYFIVEYAPDGRSFVEAGRVVAGNVITRGTYSFKHFVSGFSSLFYRLAIVEDDGSKKYSQVIRLVANKNLPLVFPTSVHDSKIHINISAPARKMQLINSTGNVVFEKQLNGISGSTTLSLPTLPKGVYIVSVVFRDQVKTAKIIIE
jgi:glucose/arabinose dehydrogenase